MWVDYWGGGGGGGKGYVGPHSQTIGGGLTPCLPPLPTPMYGEADTEEAEVSPEPATQ